MIGLRRSKTCRMIVLRTLLKILKSFKDSQIQKDTPTNQDSFLLAGHFTGQVGEGEAKETVWNFDDLLRRVNSRSRSALLAQEKVPRRLFPGFCTG